MVVEKNEPVHQYRLGRIVTAVWFDDDDNAHHSVYINRLYKPSDEDGWQRATTFGRDDHCHTWIHEVWKNDRLYHACSKCTGKWFSRSESTECPRRGSDQISVTQEAPPWAAQG